MTPLSATLCSLLLFVLLMTTPLSVMSQRNPKKGISTFAQSCSTLEPHTDSSWWYTWGNKNGFNSTSRSGRNFCYEPTSDPVAEARADGMEFVPMVWNRVPTVPLEDEGFVADLEAAHYIMSFNEPEQAAQANLSPAEAAAMWADLVTIADTYQLEIVAPCMTKDAFDWFDEWETECQALYDGSSCRYEYTCIHLYQQPHPCDVTKPWQCVGDETGYHAKNFINRWYNDYGNKPVWITEFGCYVWASGGCTVQQHQDTMTQLLSIFEAPEYADIVYRYAWYTNYDGGEAFRPGALSLENWESLPNDAASGSPTRCPDMAWLGAVLGGNACNPSPCTTGITTIGECVSRADANAQCATAPLVVTMDRDGCYCSRDACDTPVPTYGGTKSYREMVTLARDESVLTAAGNIYNSFPDDDEMTPAPDTPFPSTPVPDTPSPSTPVPDTPSPSTPVPDTPAPSTPVPDTPSPSTPVPDTPSPSTPVPDTPSPSTPVPETPTPRTPRPTRFRTPRPTRVKKNNKKNYMRRGNV